MAQARDPFREYEIKKEETTRSFLTKDEIRLLMEGKTEERQTGTIPRLTCSAPSRACHSPICAI